MTIVHSLIRRALAAVRCNAADVYVCLGMSLEARHLSGLQAHVWHLQSLGKQHIIRTLTA